MFVAVAAVAVAVQNESTAIAPAATNTLAIEPFAETVIQRTIRTRNSNNGEKFCK